MYIFNKRNGFATNSSSTHSVLELPQTEDMSKIQTDEYESFHWDFFTAADKESKINYLACLINLNLEQIGYNKKKSAAYITNLFGADVAKNINKISIDHQSVLAIPVNWDSTTLNQDFVQELIQYVTQENIVILGGNDNTEEEHNLIDRGEPSVISELPSESSNLNTVARKEEDYWTIFNRENGRKIRLSFFNKVAPEKAISPELADIKITDFCPYNCSFCYQDSTLKGQHASMDNIKFIADELEKAQVFEVACLTGDTMVLSDNGYIALGEVKIGDSLLSSSGDFKKVVKITKKRRDCIEIIGSKGFSAKCTPDHPFIVDGQIVEAKNLMNACLDQIKFDKINLEENSFIYPYKHMVVKSEHPNSRSGSTVDNNYRHSSSSKLAPKEVRLTKDLMFFYGLVVAEGSKKGVALHKNETDIAHRVGKIYNDISGNLGYKIYPNKENGIVVEFNTTSFFESIFFKEMNCGYGAKNKNLSYLFTVKNKDFIKEALYGLVVGDGCFRKKKNHKCGKVFYDFNVSLKTVSKKLALDFIALLKIHFNVQASFYKGVSPKRKIEGRTLDSSVYFSVEINGKTNINKVFPEIFKNDDDYKKIGSSIYSKNKTKDFIKIKEIKSIGEQVVYDITLEENSTHIYCLSHGVLTHNCGGGETTLHPNFVEILKIFKDRKIIPNFTTKNLNLLRQSNAKQILEHCGAMAFSVESVEDMYKVKSAFLDCSKKDMIESTSYAYLPHDLKTSIWNPKLTFQVVMGTMPMKEFKSMLELASSFGSRITLLGYKENGRGNTFAPHDYSNWLELVIEMKKQNRLVVSIDTALASEYEQELVQKGVEQNTFHTTEGTFSIYIDATKMTVSPSSYVGLEQTQDFDSTWLEKYKGMKAKPVYQKTIKIRS